MLTLLKRRPLAPVTAEAPPAPAVDPQLVVGLLTQSAGTIGRDAAEVRGVIEDSSRVASGQVKAMQELAARLQEVVAEQGRIDSESQHSLQAVQGAREALQSLGTEVAAIVDTLKQVSEAAGQITQIALQTRLVAFNASVEAKRAGEAGRGFGVVADAVKDLAARVESSSKQITGTVGTLQSRFDHLQRETSAPEPGAEAGAVHQALERVQGAVGSIGGAAERGRAMCRRLDEGVHEIEATVKGTARALDDALGRTESFLQTSENMIEMVARCGVRTEDTRYIEAAQQAAAEVSALLEDAVRNGSIAEADLFDERYVPIEGSSPAQHTTRFVALAERLFPQVQEKLLSLSDKVVFCISVDRNGYVACHNRKYNQPQRAGDTVWNTANCRNKRIFADRTGLASARNHKPFLLQTYRRDMGGGQFVIMKEASSPITVGGRHWGGLRLAFRF